MVVRVVFTALSSRRHRLSRKKAKLSPRLIWGPDSIINNKYYSLALQEAGFSSKTLMQSTKSIINSRSDYDIYYEDLAPKGFPKFFAIEIFHEYYFSSYSAFCFAVNNFDIFHHPFTGGFLRDTVLRKWEARILRLAGCKTVILGYGGDFYRYSKILNSSWLHGMLTHYFELGLQEPKTNTNVMYWSKNADFIINGMQIDHLGRWDALPFRAEVIDLDAWKPKEIYSQNDGINGPVHIFHAPNHRVIKGTEFLIKAVEELQTEGLEVHLILMEKRPNEEVKKILHERTDICFDQLNLGYAMSAIEGFASGIPVLTNLENENYVRVFRRYSFLNECPALSVSHENLKDNLRILIRNPKLREQLGRAGRKYAAKYHSYRTAKEFFGAVYSKIWLEDKGKDLINFYHPILAGSFNKSFPLVQHPLEENRIPSRLEETLQN